MFENVRSIFSGLEVIGPNDPGYNFAQNLNSSNLSEGTINFLLSGLSDTMNGLPASNIIPDSLNGLYSDLTSGRYTYSSGTNPLEEISKTQNNITNAPPLSFPLTLGKDFMFVQFGTIKRTRPSEKGSFIPNTSVALPLPAQLTEQHQVTLSSPDTGLIGAGINNIESIMKQMDLLKQGAPANKEELRSLMNDSLGLGYYMVKPLLSPFGLEQVADYIGERVGAVPNPHAAVFFHGVELRPAMEFSWLFSPRTAEESARLRQIIKIFKQKSLPVLSTGSSNLMGYPHYVEIQLSPQKGNGKTNQSLPIYKRGLIETINVNYSPNGPSFFHDDNPTFVIFSFIFRESEVFTADDFAEGGLNHPSLVNTIEQASNFIGSSLNFGTGTTAPRIENQNLTPQS